MSASLINLRWRYPAQQLDAAGALIGPRGPAGILYDETIGDGVETVFLITHGLGTRKFVVNIYATAGDQPDVMADVYRPADGGENTIRIEFLSPPTVGQFCVVIVGVAS